MSSGRRRAFFKALPSDLSAYPNLEALTEKYTIFEKLLVDGNLYAFPKIKNNNPYNEYDSYMFAYRRDWANAMGLDYAPVQDLTWDEFKDYLRKVKAEDPGQLGEKLIPFDFENGGNSWWASRASGTRTSPAMRWWTGSTFGVRPIPHRWMRFWRLRACTTRACLRPTATRMRTTPARSALWPAAAP